MTWWLWLIVIFIIGGLVWGFWEEFIKNKS